MANETDNLASLIAKLPKPAPIDEIKIMETEGAEKRTREKAGANVTQPFNWVKALMDSISSYWRFLYCYCFLCRG